MEITIRKKEVKSILTKSAPHHGYTANPYAGCSHNCLYCYAKYLPEWTGHDNEKWGEYVDVKYWEPLNKKIKAKLKGENIFISSATDPYMDLEAEFGRTHELLTELRGTGANVLVVTKSANVVWDAALFKELGATVALSINTLDEGFKNQMDNAHAIQMRLSAMEALHKAGVYTTCFISPIFPGITDAPAIIERCKGICDEIYLEHLVLCPPYKGPVLYFIRTKYPELYPYYDRLFNRKQLDEWWEYDEYMKQWCEDHKYVYSYEHLPKKHRDVPVVVNFRGHKGK